MVLITVVFLKAVILLLSMNEVRDFTLNYQFGDFKCLVTDLASDGIICDGVAYDQDGIGYVAECLLFDYEEKRANAFGYLTRNMSGRTLMELRKTAILQVEDSFLDWFDEEHDYKDVIKRRIDMFRPYVSWIIGEEYHDENWQYDWLVHLFIPLSKRDNLEYKFEAYLNDGDLARDAWADPLKHWKIKEDSHILFS